MISSKGRYALRVMIDLARQESDGYVPLKEIAERQGISKKYLEIIAKELVNAKLLKGVSGKGGGYRLSRKPEEYPGSFLPGKRRGGMSESRRMRYSPDVVGAEYIDPRFPLFQKAFRFNIIMIPAALMREQFVKRF